MSYCKSSNCWSGLKEYDLNGIKHTPIVEKYTPRVTIPYSEWVNYIGSGKNVILGSGGVIPGGTVNTGWGMGGSVYKGHVSQGY